MKLFSCVQPRVAVFGKKDYQQLMIIRHMCRQFALPTEIVRRDRARRRRPGAVFAQPVPESCRARQAPRLYRVLNGVRDRILGGNTDVAATEAAAKQELAASEWKVDYVSVRRRRDLKVPAPDEVGREPLVVLAAAKLGITRLIDNLEI